MRLAGYGMTGFARARTAKARSRRRARITS